MVTQNYDEAVKRAWDRQGVNVRVMTRKGFHWGRPHGDPLMIRQLYMQREGRHSLHNMILGDHGKPNRY